MGLGLKLKVVDSVTDILKAIENGEANLAAAGLTRTDVATMKNCAPGQTR
jgi:membrane-bound lytic murein transglycosylase MltF